LNSKEKIIQYFNDLEEVKRLKELEPYIKSNNEINKKFDELKDIQKKMVASKELELTNQYLIYQKEYNKTKEELLDLPFVDEYLELVDYVNQMLDNLANEINYLIDKDINKWLLQYL